MSDNKKKRIRSMRVAARNNDDGTVSSHKMTWTGDPSKKRGGFGVFPSITPKAGKETSTNKEDWEDQSPKQAMAKGEFIPVKRKKTAEKLAGGSWKKGRDKREAMSEYRRNKLR